MPGRFRMFSHIGATAVRRGDVIRCTVLFDDEKEEHGKFQVPVVFSVNGSRIVPEGDQTVIEYSSDRKLYPYIAFLYENSVLAKVFKTTIRLYFAFYFLLYIYLSCSKNEV